MNSTSALLSLADDIAIFVYRSRRQKPPELPYDLFDTYNDWAHSTGIIIHDADTVVLVCQLMSILFSVPLPMLVTVVQFDGLKLHCMKGEGDNATRQGTGV